MLLGYVNLPPVIANDPFALMARLRGPDGHYLARADWIAIDFIVTDTATGEEVAEGSLDPSLAIFDTLVGNSDDPRFPAKGAGDGYNFLHEFDGTEIPYHGNRYEVRYALESAVGPVHHWGARLTAL